jgi:cation transport regulator ChaC
MWKKYHAFESEPELLYFAYGSCMDNDRFIKQGVDHLFQNVVGRGVLDGYSLSFPKIREDGGRADIVEGEGTVEGKVYKIDQEALEYLFNREGVYTDLYRPIFVDITLNGKRTKDVLTFTVIDKKENAAPPEVYATEILRGGKGTLSEEYLTKIKNFFLNH